MTEDIVKVATVAIALSVLPAKADHKPGHCQGGGEGNTNCPAPPSTPSPLPGDPGVPIEEVAGITPPQKEVAEALPPGPISPTIRQLPTVGEVRDALEQLSAPVYSATQTQVQSGAQTVRSAVDARVDTALDTIGTGETDIEPRSRYAQTRVIGTPVDARTPGGQNFWSQGFWSRTDKGSQTTDAGGMFFGFDTRVFETGMIGVLAGYDQSDMTDPSSRSNGDSYTVGAYAGALLHDHWTVRLGSTYTTSETAVSRQVAFGNFFAVPYGEVDARVAQAFGAIGYKFRFGEATTVEPYVDYAYVHARAQPFSELDEAAALAVGGSSSGTSFLTPGVRVTHRFEVGDVPVKMKARAAWRRQLNELTPSSTIAFLNDAAPRLVFTVPGEPTVKDTMLADFGFDASVTQALNISLTYNGQFSKDAKQHGATALLRYKF